MRKFVVLLMGLVVMLSGIAQTIPNLVQHSDQANMNKWVDSLFQQMTYDQRIGQLFMVIADPKSDNRTIQKLTRYVDEVKIGGVLFHKGDPVAQAEVTNWLQNRAQTPLFIALDGEWGLSMRLNGTTRFPKSMMLGAIENDHLIVEYGKEVGRQCKEMGIHINFAPALDVNSNTDNPVIGLRSFGENPEAVADKGIAYASGLESTGIISVAKHYPGHGDTSDDSHHTLPLIRHSRARLDSVELVPFKRYISAGFAGMMTAHLYVPAFDKRSKKPASFSRAIVTDLLQDSMGFRGLTFTDALAMKGASSGTNQNPSVMALLAGNDILLASSTPIDDFAAVKKALEEGVLDLKEIEARCRKILQYKYIAGLNRYKPIDTKGLLGRLNAPHAAWLAAKLNAESITLLKNESNYLPLKELNKNKIAVLSIGDKIGNEFQQTLNQYDSVACFSLVRQSTAAQIKQVYDQLLGYDLIICGVNTVRIPESEQLRLLASKKKVVFVFFTLPYFCAQYKHSIERSKALLLAYEGTPLAKAFAAQILFGGSGAKGKLPVTIPGLYYAGTGEFTSKTRLGYHAPEAVGMNSARLAEIDSIVLEGLKERAYPGCQVLVAKDGFVVYEKAFGYYDFTHEQPVTNESVYDLASLSKAAGTLLAVMKSFDNKQITLQSKIGAYLPSLKNSNKADLTLQELLFHQSGVVPTIAFYQKAIDQSSYTGRLFASSKTPSHPIPLDANTYVRDDFAFLPSLVSLTPQKGFTTEVARDLYVHDSFQDSIMKEMADSKLGSRGRYVYSCINFILLQKIVEKQRDMPLDIQLTTDYYSRLGAWRTTYNPLKKMDTRCIVPTEDDRFLRHQLLRGYVHDEAAAFQGGVSGNAGLFSNANDLAKLLQLLLLEGEYGGERYLSRETTRLFTQRKSTSSRRGLGFDKPAIGTPKSSPCGLFAPASVYGHTGFTGTCFWVDPDNQLIYIFLSNRVFPTHLNNKLGALNIRTRIQDAMYKAMDRKNEKEY